MNHYTNDQMTDRPSMDHKLIDKLTEAIESNLQNEQFGVPELAEEAGLSKSQLNRRLQVMTNQSASQFIREYRLKRAMELLQSKAATPTEVAYKVGFGSPSYFSTCFKEFYGYSPGEVEQRKPKNKKKGSSKSYKILLISLTALILITVLYFSFRAISSKQAKDHPSVILDKSIAVLPFWNDSPDSTNIYFCVGMEDEIRLHLTKISELIIIPRHSIEKYRENTGTDIKSIANELKVPFIVGGSVRRNGNEVRIIVYLIDVKTGDQIWSDDYDADYSEKMLDFQKNTSKEIAAALNAEITPAEENRIDKRITADMDAYDFYIKGNYEKSLYYKNRHKEHIKKSHQFLDKALQIDPNFSVACVSKAATYLLEAQWDSMLIYCNRAIRIDPDNATAYGRKARYFQNIGQPDSAIQNLLIAHKLQPDNSLTNLQLGEMYFYFKKNIKKGLPYLIRSIELFNRNYGEGYLNIGRIFHQFGEYEIADMFLRKNLELSTNCRGFDSWNSLQFLQGNYAKIPYYTDSICGLLNCEYSCYKWQVQMSIYQEDYDKAKQYIEKWQTDEGEQISSPLIGYVAYKTGRSEDAVAAFNSVIERIDPMSDSVSARGNPLRYELAQIYAFRNDADSALDLIQEIINAGYSYYRIEMMTIDPMFENLWDNPEFIRIVEELQAYRSDFRTQFRALHKSKPNLFTSIKRAE